MKELPDFPRYTGVHPAPPPVRREEPDWEAYTGVRRSRGVNIEQLAKDIEARYRLRLAQENFSVLLGPFGSTSYVNVGITSERFPPMPRFPEHLPLFQRRPADEMRQTTAPKSKLTLKQFEQLAVLAMGGGDFTAPPAADSAEQLARGIRGMVCGDGSERPHQFQIGDRVTHEPPGQSGVTFTVDTLHDHGTIAGVDDGGERWTILLGSMKFCRKASTERIVADEPTDRAFPITYLWEPRRGVERRGTSRTTRWASE